MQTINNLFEIDKIIRDEIFKLSEIKDKTRIINALSIRGPKLEKYINESLYGSPDSSDTIIIFENSLREDSNNNCNITEEDDSLTTYTCIQTSIIIYGNSSQIVAHKIKSRILTDYEKQSLYENGLYIENVSNPISLNDFINDNIWLRADLIINSSCKMSINQISKFPDFENISKVNIIKEE